LAQAHLARVEHLAWLKQFLLMGAGQSEEYPGVSTNTKMSAPHLQVMSNFEGLQIKEKANKIEAITALIGQEIEMPNKYRIFDQTGERELFYAVEKTDFITRQLKQCFPSCSPWSVDIFYTETGDRTLAYHLERPWSFTAFGLNRPVVDVIDVPAGRKIGKITQPCTCFNMSFAITNEDGAIPLTVDGGCCQPGLCCPLPCGPCSVVHFDVLDAKAQPVGSLKKKLPGCCSWFFAPDVDNYHLDFPRVPEAKNRVLLMALAIFMDFRYFSNNKNDEGGDTGGLLGGSDDF